MTPLRCVGYDQIRTVTASWRPCWSVGWPLPGLGPGRPTGSCSSLEDFLGLPCAHPGLVYLEPRPARTHVLLDVDGESQPVRRELLALSSHTHHGGTPRQRRRRAECGARSRLGMPRLALSRRLSRRCDGTVAVTGGRWARSGSEGGDPLRLATPRIRSPEQPVDLHIW